MAGEDDVMGAAAVGVAAPGALAALEDRGCEAGILDVLVECAGALKKCGGTLPDGDDGVRAALAGVAHHAATAASTPPEAVFADVGGDPKDAKDCQTSDARAWSARAAACLRLAAAALAQAARPGDLRVAAATRAPKPPPVKPPPRIELAEDLWNVAGRLADSGPRAVAKGLVIEVIGGDDDGEGGEGGGGVGGVEEEGKPKHNPSAAASDAAAIEAATRVADAAAATLLLCALYAQDAHLDGGWAAGPVVDAVEEALQTLVGIVGREGGGQEVAAGSSRPPPPSPLAPDLAVARLLPSVVMPLATVLIQNHWRSLDTASMEPYAGPGVYERATAARAAAWLVRVLPAARMRAATDVLLPTLVRPRALSRAGPSRTCTRAPVRART